MGRSTLVVAGIAAGIVVLVGSWVMTAALLREPVADPATSRHSIESIPGAPADRIGTRGIVPLTIDAELGALEVYFVGSDGGLHPPPQGLRLEVWRLMTRIMTPQGAGEALATYQVGDNPASSRTAWVVRHGLRQDEWILGVNLATSDDPTRLAATLIHEYAHLIAFRDGQVVPAGDGCTTVLLAEGCARPGGYLAAFHHAFWAEYGPAAPDIDNADAGAAAAHRAAHPDDFVSEYAAMNAVEDFAESFAAYVHAADVPPDLFDGRLAFFSRFEEMVAIRDHVRAELDGILGTYRAG